MKYMLSYRYKGSTTFWGVVQNTYFASQKAAEKRAEESTKKNPSCIYEVVERKVSFSGKKLPPPPAIVTRKEIK